MTQSYIYIIGPENGPFKVGYSVTPDDRCRQLQTGQPMKLRVHHRRTIETKNARAMEQLIHRQLNHFRIKGEWFNIPLGDLIQEIDFAFIRWSDTPNLSELLKMRLI